MKATAAAILGTLVTFAAIPAAAGQDETRPAAPETEAEAPEEIVITVLADGSLRLGGRPVRLEDLSEKLRALVLKEKDQPVRIRGEGEVPYSRILEVIDACREATTRKILFGEADPRPAAPKAEEAHGEIIINVLADGGLRVEGQPCGLEELEGKLRAIALQNENQPVRIRSDKAVPFRRIAEVIGTCQQAGIWNISFAIQPASNLEE